MPILRRSGSEELEVERSSKWLHRQSQITRIDQLTHCLNKSKALLESNRSRIPTARSELMKLRPTDGKKDGQIFG